MNRSEKIVLKFILRFSFLAENGPGSKYNDSMYKSNKNFKKVEFEKSMTDLK